MIDSRKPRGRKCSAARITACSKSGCSNSFTGLALLRLPLPRVFQRGKTAKIKAGERIQTLSQHREPGLRLAELLADGPQHRAHTRRFRWGNLEHALKTSVFAEVALHGQKWRKQVDCRPTTGIMAPRSPEKAKIPA